MSKVPKTRIGWYILGQKLIEYMCSEVNCGNEPSESVCSKCLLHTLSENLKFHYELGTRVYISMIYYWKGHLKETVEKARQRLVERGLLHKT